MTTTTQTSAKQHNPTSNQQPLTPKHWAELTGKRKLSPEWVEANCRSIGLEEASSLLGYPAKSSGILIQGAGWQQQFKPDIPWASEEQVKEGKKKPKKPKYRTPTNPPGQTGYDAILPSHPTEKDYWYNLEKLRARALTISDDKGNLTHFIIVTEGGFKSIAGCANELPTVGLLGVEMGLTSSKDDIQGKRYLIYSLERLAKAGFGFIMAFDADCALNPNVIAAEAKLTHQLRKFGVPVKSITGLWAIEEGKGMDDYIAKNGIEAFRQKLLNLYEIPNKLDSEGKSQKIPPADIIAKKIAEDYGDNLKFNNETKLWMRYEAEFPGVWSQETDEYMQSIVSSIVDSRGISGYGSNAYIVNILKKIQHLLIEKKWSERPANELIPFENGVLEIKTGNLLEHSPGYRFTWCIPRQHNLLATDWSSINDYLDAVSQNNQNLKDIYLAFANAVLKGRADLQKFVHLIGLGGSGKGTFGRLLTDLIGQQNVLSTTLDDWCNNRFESANAYRKRLIVFWDEDKVMDKIGKFLSLTGGDWIRGEEKGRKAFQYKFDGMCLVLSNKPIFVGSAASRVSRRAITIPCNNQPAKSKIRDLNAEFQGQLDAFTNYVLSIPDEKVTRILKGLLETPECQAEFWENRMRTDAIAAWVNEWVVQDPTASTLLGMNKDEGQDDKPKTLYGSYSLFCRQAGMSAKSHVNFSSDLVELCNVVLGWEVEKRHTNRGKVISGLRLRTLYDEQIPTHDDFFQSVSAQSQNLGDSLSSDGLGDGLGDGLYSLPSKAFSDGDGLNDIEVEIENQKRLRFTSIDELKATISALVDKLNFIMNEKGVGSQPSQSSQSLSDKDSQPSPQPSPKSSLELESLKTTPAGLTGFDSYPHLTSNDIRAKENEATKLRQALLDASSKEELTDIKDKWGQRCIWVWKHLLSKVQKAKVRAITKTEQLEIDLTNRSELPSREPQQTEIPFIQYGDGEIAIANSQPAGASTPSGEPAPQQSPTIDPEFKAGARVIVQADIRSLERLNGHEGVIEQVNEISAQGLVRFQDGEVQWIPSRCLLIIENEF